MDRQQPEPSGAQHGEASAPGQLEGARRRRLVLREAMGILERVVAAPAAAPGWSDQVLDALGSVESALRDHVAEVEQSSGLLAAALETAPRLAPAVDRLRADHTEIAGALTDAARALRSPDAAADAAAVRRQVMAVLGMLAEHRQRGSDLVYDTYAVDIGGE